MIDWESLPPLTQSGAGCALDWSVVAGDADSIRELQALLANRRFAVLHGVGSDVESAKAILRNLGPLVEHEKREDGVLSLDGSKDEEEVLRGQEYMPLHKDGLLMGISVQWVGIFCEVFRDVSNGRTFISDASCALDAIPRDVLEALEQYGIEAEAVDSDYYLKEAAKWHPLVAIEKRPAGVSLNLGLPYRAGTRPSWRVRIAKVAQLKSDQLLAELEAVLMASRYLYQHEWREGDLLLFDNQRVLHGRESYTGSRRLANLQVC